MPKTKGNVVVVGGDRMTTRQSSKIPEETTKAHEDCSKQKDAARERIAKPSKSKRSERRGGRTRGLDKNNEKQSKRSKKVPNKTNNFEESNLHREEESDDADENNIVSSCNNMFGTKCLYSVLGLERDASDLSIRKAYHTTALKYHPDKHTDAKLKCNMEERFKIICQLYQVLSDPIKRDLYDRTGRVSCRPLLPSDCLQMYVHITTADIDSYLASYKGSQEEKKELIEFYEKFTGNWDEIGNNLISHSIEEEPRLKKIITDAIANGEVHDYGIESESVVKRRFARLKREKRQAEKGKGAKGVEKSVDLVNSIRQRQAERRKRVTKRLNDLVDLDKAQENDEGSNDSAGLVDEGVKPVKRGRKTKNKQ